MGMNPGFLFNFKNVSYDFASRTYVMGILNVTPDSFSDGGRYFSTDEAVNQGQKQVDDGADILDIGGESTRPGSEPVSTDEELKRVIPVIERLAAKIGVPISIDTYKSAVAEAALNAGAEIVNDVSALTFDPKIASVVAKHKAAAVLMHMKGAPKSMQDNPSYENVTEEVKKYLAEKVKLAGQIGIEKIIADPGIGFGKKLEHNIKLIQDLSSFSSLGVPILIGPSRKSFLGSILNLPAGDRLEGTAASVVVSILNGANIIRVHDVKVMKRAALVADALKPSHSKVRI